MKDLKISAELLSEVLKLEVVKHSLYNELHKSFNITYMQSEDSLKSSWMPINVYEFTFKCKEWAMSKGYQIISGLSDEPAYRKQDEKAYAKVLWYEGDDVHREYKDMYFMANTEIEALIKASEYVLKEINEKDTTNIYTY